MSDLSHPAADRQGIGAPGPDPLRLQATAHVLVVDDDEAVGLVLSRTLTRLGYSSDVAADGAQAITLFEADPAQYSLVLLDFKLPGMDSGTVYRRLRVRRPDLPVILMSGYNREEALGNAAGLELAGFLHKPFTRETLASALGNSP